MTNKLELHILGHVALFCGDEAQPMTPSRKTRSLLAYLALTNKAHPRDHLCALFFAHAHDPRGALRWSLSRIRRLLHDAGTGHFASALQVRQDAVQLDTDRIDLDLDAARSAAEQDGADGKSLVVQAERLSDRPLAHLDLPRCAEFSAWIAQQEDDIQHIRAKIIQRIASAPEVPDTLVLTWLETWISQDPGSKLAAKTLWQHLQRNGQVAEAKAVERAYQARSCSTEVFHSDARPYQTVARCKTSDGVQIAYASVGSGPPIVKAANWLNHLEEDWTSPIWAETFQALSSTHTLIRYDERGNGLSDWDVDEISLEAFVRDLETVVNELQLDQFPLLGMSQGCAVSIAYATRHPHRVSSLILIGGYAAGWRIGMTPDEIEQREAVLTLTRHGWGRPNPAYRHIFSSTFMPDADAARLDWFDEFQRKTTSPENAVRFQEAFGDIDVRHLLKQVKVPTLVLHAKDDQRIPLSHGKALADGIEGSRFVTLNSRNHIILGDEPAWQVCMDEISAFLARYGEEKSNKLQF